MPKSSILLIFNKTSNLKKQIYYHLTIKQREMTTLYTQRCKQYLQNYFICI